MSDLPFAPHRGPHADFLIACNATGELDAKMTACGASIRRHATYTAYLWRYPEGDVLMSGTGVIDGRYIVGPRALSSVPSSLSIGNFFVLHFGPDHASVRADTMGMGVIYAGRGLVTNRLHLAAIAVGELDIPSALTTTYAEHMFCIQFPVCETPVSGISVLAFDESAEVTKAVRIVRRERQTRCSVASPSDYHELVQAGAQEIVANVEAILRSGRPVVCDISGGRDSRVVLAALVALDRMGDVRFFTKVGLKARGDLDAAIGSGLVKRFGGEYGPAGTISGYSVDTVENAFNRRRSQLFGAYHSITPNILNCVSADYDEPFVRMMGGTGEMYRDYYQRFFRHNDEPYDDRALEEVLAGRCGRIFGDRWLPSYLSRFERTFASLPGRTIGQKLDGHYLNFRNRFHFGLRPTRDDGPLTVSPAASPSLLSAAMSLPASEKTTGRVLFDVTRALCEELAYYPHDKPYDFDLTASPYHRPSRFDGMDLALPPAVETLSRQNAARPKRPKVEKPAFLPTLREIAAAHFDGLRDTPFAEVATEDLGEHLRKIGETHWRKMAAWTSRLQAFSDYASTMR